PVQAFHAHADMPTPGPKPQTHTALQTTADIQAAQHLRLIAQTQILILVDPDTFEPKAVLRTDLPLPIQHCLDRQTLPVTLLTLKASHGRTHLKPAIRIVAVPITI